MGLKIKFIRIVFPSRYLRLRLQFLGRLNTT